MVQILVSLLLVVASLAGFTGTLYAAQDDLPGQTLYPLKTWSEDVRVALTVDPARQVELLIDITQRRVEEIVTLARAGQDPPETVLQRMEQHFYRAMERAAAQGDAQMMRTLALVEARLHAMQQIVADAPQTPVRERVWAQLEAWRRLAQTGEADPAQFRQQIREQVQRNIPVSPEPSGPSPMQTPGMGPGFGPVETPGAGPGPMMPPGPGPMQTPGMGPGFGPVETPGAGPGPMTPPGPGPMQTPGMGPGSGPVETPGVSPGPMMPSGMGPGSGPMETPGAGPGPGPMATDTPVPGRGDGRGH
jgi:chorismate mutase